MKFNCIFSTIVDFFYPKVCISCRDIVEENNKLCPECEKRLSYIENDKRCSKCGNQKPDCDCKRHIYYFEGALSVFFNCDSARNIVYRYKLSGKRFLSNYITDKMVDTLNDEYKDKKFDYLVAVPTSFRSLNKRGFDHIYTLAKEISEKTGIPIKNNVLGVKKFKRSQHKSGYKERFSNVKNKYYIKNRLECENVLLIDDIKTTGATLNACSRELLYAGAKRVYCLTALGGNKPKEPKNVSDKKV